MTGADTPGVESPYVYTSREAQAIDEIVELTCERESYRLLAQQAIHALYRATLEEAQLRERYRLLLNELRALRRGKRQPR